MFPRLSRSTPRSVKSLLFTGPVKPIANSTRSASSSNSVPGRQKIHREVDSGEVSAGHLEIARHSGADRNADGVELRAQFFDGEIFANVDAGTELHALALELIEARIENRFLELEFRNSEA